MSDELKELEDLIERIKIDGKAVWIARLVRWVRILQKENLRLAIELGELKELMKEKS